MVYRIELSLYIYGGRERCNNYASETLFFPLPPFYSITFFSLINPSIYHLFMFSYQFPLPYFLRLLIETNCFLQMHFNLNFPWFIFILGHFTIYSSTRFPRAPSVFLQLCKRSLHCKPLYLPLPIFLSAK